MIKDPWNPTAEEIREWAFSDELWPEQDWDLAVNDGNNASLLLALACDSKCPNRKFFLHAFYFMVGDASFRDAPKERIDELGAMIVAIEGDLHSDVQQWRAEATELLSNPATFEYSYWCGHMFHNPQRFAPNRTLTSTLESTSSFRGSEQS